MPRPFPRDFRAFGEGVYIRVIFVVLNGAVNRLKVYVFMKKKTKRILIITAVSVAVIAAVAGTVLGIMFCGGGHQHFMRTVRARAATCTEDGNSAYYHCEDCGKYFADMLGESEISPEDAVIPATGHDMEYVQAREPSCTQAGEEAHWQCLNCGKAFADEGASEEIASEGLVIPAEGHDMDDGTETVAAQCGVPGEMTYSCLTCGYTETSPLPALEHVFDRAASDGAYHWTECSLCGAERENSRGMHDFVLNGAAEECACGAHIAYAEGLQYAYADGGYAVTGAGDFEGGFLFIPPEYDDGEHGVRPVTAVADEAFMNRPDIVIVRLPDSVAQVGDRAFFMCAGAAFVTFGAGVEDIGDAAFYGCSLTDIALPAALAHIGEQAFGECPLVSAAFARPEGWTDGSGAPANFGDAAAAAALLSDADGPAFDRA